MDTSPNQHNGEASPGDHRIVSGYRAEPYQDRIARSVRDAIACGRSGAVLAPTGSGKSLLATAGAEDSIELGKPVLVLHPDISLLPQNHSQFQASPRLSQARQSFYVAKSENVGADAMLRDTLDADLIPATNMSLVNKLDDEAFMASLDDFGRRGGIVIIDEGHKAAAEQLSRVLARIAQAGGSGIVLTATPFRTDGQDPLEIHPNPKRKVPRNGPEMPDQLTAAPSRTFSLSARRGA